MLATTMEFKVFCLPVCYYSPYIIRMIKSRKIRWEGCAAHMNKMKNAHTILVEKTAGRQV
jgi:hypothetical protein